MVEASVQAGGRDGCCLIKVTLNSKRDATPDILLDISSLSCFNLSDPVFERDGLRGGKDDSDI